MGGCLTGGYVLYKDMSYGRICFPEGYVLQENMSYWWHALREDMF